MESIKKIVYTNAFYDFSRYIKHFDFKENPI